MTKSPLDRVKPSVRAAAAYTLKARVASVKINQNENPFDVPRSVKERVVRQALERPWSRYPDFHPGELLQALARHIGWRPEGVLAGNGSNELIQALLMVTVGSGTRVVIPEPTFSLYALLTTILGGEAVRVPLRAEFAYDAAALIEAQRRTDAALVVACSPNNPTGGSLSPDDVRKLCEAVDALVVVDEAYGEFARRSVVPLLADCPNLVVLRTFSKAMALAGARVGTLAAAPDLVGQIDKARLPYNINFFSQAAALAALDEAPALRQTVERIIGLRDALFAALSGTPGVRPYRSDANFILFALDGPTPSVVFEHLLEQGVLVRDVSGSKGLEKCLRVSVGTPDENARFLESLQRILRATSVGASR